jgi:hypothetical protein
MAHDIGSFRQKIIQKSELFFENCIFGLVITKDKVMIQATHSANVQVKSPHASPLSFQKASVAFTASVSAFIGISLLLASI